MRCETGSMSRNVSADTAAPAPPPSIKEMKETIRKAGLATADLLERPHVLRVQPPQLAASQSLLRCGLSLIPQSVLEKAYTSWLGFYNSHLGRLGWSREELVRDFGFKKGHARKAEMYLAGLASAAGGGSPPPGSGAENEELGSPPGSPVPGSA